MSSLQTADTTFAELLQDLPPNLLAQAREFQAFTRARVLKTPAQLLRVVFLYCGLDQSLRTTSATCAQLGQALTDNAVRERLLACGPWLTALLRQMLPALPAGVPPERRFILVDGSVIQAPGATRADYRLHLGWDWFNQTLAFLEISTVATGESLARFAWHRGDVAVADRNFATAAGLAAALQRGADVIARLHLAHDIQPFFHHELFHVYHAQFFDECAQAWCALWMEGLATLAAQRLNPGASDAELLLNQPRPIRADVERDRSAAVCAVARLVDSKAAADYAGLFSNGPALEGLPPRVGYYVGYLVAEEAARGRSLMSLAHLRNPAARKVVDAAFAGLSRCKAG